MDKKNKYIIGALLGGALLMFILYFVVGGKKAEYVITFDTDGGSVVASQRIVEGKKATKPNDPTKENYNFLRWEYENQEYNFNQEIKKDMTLKAIWEEIKQEEQLYDVQFVFNGVTKNISVSRITEQDLIALGFEEKDGYEIKWYVNDTEYNFNEPLTGNVSLVGKYVKSVTYTVKFNSDGGSAVPTQKVKPNEMATEPTEVTKYGFILDGWYLNKSKYDFATPVTKNITLVAKWTEDTNVARFEVTFDSDGGSKVDKQRIIENEKASEPKAPTKTGYKFLGWYLNDKKYDFKTSVTGNITLKASWEKIIQYTVTFNKDNGGANETKLVNSGEKVSKPSNPTKEGYKFVGWLLDNQTFDFNTPITGDITLIAQYTALAQFTVTFDSDGGSNVPSKTVYDGSKVARPSDPTKDEYDFVEWQLNGNKYNFDSAVTQNITLKAKWKAKTYDYTVEVSKVDNYSPDSRLTVKRNGTVITVKEIKYSDGVHLCNGSNTVVSTANLDGQTTLLLVLTNDTLVRANIVR